MNSGAALLLVSLSPTCCTQEVLSALERGAWIEAQYKRGRGRGHLFLVFSVGPRKKKRKKKSSSAVCLSIPLQKTRLAIIPHARAPSHFASFFEKVLRAACTIRTRARSADTRLDHTYTYRLMSENATLTFGGAFPFCQRVKLSCFSFPFCKKN